MIKKSDYNKAVRKIALKQIKLKVYPDNRLTKPKAKTLTTLKTQK